MSGKPAEVQEVTELLPTRFGALVAAGDNAEAIAGFHRAPRLPPEPQPPATAAAPIRLDRRRFAPVLAGQPRQQPVLKPPLGETAEFRSDEAAALAARLGEAEQDDESKQFFFFFFLKKKQNKTNANCYGGETWLIAVVLMMIR